MVWFCGLWPDGFVVLVSCFHRPAAATHAGVRACALIFSYLLTCRREASVPIQTDVCR